MNLEKIKQNSLAGFLQKEIVKKVQREAEIEYNNLTRYEIPPYEKPKKLPLTAGIYNFVKWNIINELRP